LYYVIKIRRDIVAYNLCLAFPEKTYRTGCYNKEFYKGFIDNFIETINSFPCREKIKKRFTGIEVIIIYTAKTVNFLFLILFPDMKELNRFNKIINKTFVELLL